MSLDDRLSVQLYSGRKTPLDQVLETVAALGYRNVEPYGGLLAKADEIQPLLKKHNLAAPTCHVPLDGLRNDFDTTVGNLKKLGVRLALVPAIHPPARPTDAAGWKALGRELSELRRRLAAEGITLGWHNHDFEFLPTDGEIPMTILLEADPELAWEADLGWIVRAGQDPMTWLETWGDRIRALHIKDLAPQGEALDEDGWADVGHGRVDWQRLMPRLNAELLVVEHDNPSDFERFARRSRAAMQAW